MTQFQVEAKYGPVWCVVRSSRDPNEKYEVRRKDGVFSCRCKGWIFSKKSPRTCRHCDEARRRENEETRATATTPVNGGKSAVIAEKIIAVLVRRFGNRLLPDTKREIANILRESLGEPAAAAVAVGAGWRQPIRMFVLED